MDFKTFQVYSSLIAKKQQSENDKNFKTFQVYSSSNFPVTIPGLNEDFKTFQVYSSLVELKALLFP